MTELEYRTATPIYNEIQTARDQRDLETARRSRAVSGLSANPALAYSETCTFTDGTTGAEVFLTRTKQVPGADFIVEIDGTIAAYDAKIIALEAQLAAI